MGTNDTLVALIASTALKIDLVLLLFGEIAKYKEACERKNNPSGKPTRSKASQQDCTTTIALGSARPISSQAEIKSLLKIKFGSSPASTILASQYKVASGSEPLIDFINALITSK